MTQHTPGPWYVRGAPATYQHEMPRDITSGPSLIATACMLNNFRGETLANARLIAAAPDMLEALKRQQANIRRWLETGEAASPDESKSISDQIDAAIAKAEGR